MKHYFLGMAANYSGARLWQHLFAFGRQRDCDELQRYLSKRYSGEAMLCKNGRSALALALEAYFNPGDAVLVNGFTCYAVYEAVRAAKLVPVFADIEKSDLNFSIGTLADAATGRLEAICDNGSKIASEPRNDGREQSGPREDWSCIRGVIVQNTLGNPVDIKAVEKFAKKHDLTIIEDLAHSTGVKYPDGREAGTVGAACVLSFGKDKSIDTISGGAVILRDPCKNVIKAPSNRPKPTDHLRARFYPLLGAICRGLSYVRLGGALMRLLVKIHWVEKSADNRLGLTQKISKFEAKLALGQLKALKKSGEPPLREFYLVRDRVELLKKLQSQGYYLQGFWYEKPVSPQRYYQRVHFPEADCPNAVYVANHIVNVPTFYPQKALDPARKMIKEYLEEAK